MSILDTIYKNSPLIIQNLGISIFGAYWKWLRFGGNFQLLQNDYKSREEFSQQEWREFQHQKLCELLTYATMHVPYYSKNWSNTQKQAAIRGWLWDLPLLEKEPVRQNPLDFIRGDQKNRRVWTFYTSGSTGTPIATLWDAEEIRKSMAVREVRSANWAGVSFHLPRATFSGRMVEPNPDSKGPYYRYNSVEKQVYFSPFHLRPETAHNYVDALIKHDIQWMTGYAVSYYLLAKFIIDEGLRVPPVKAVITTSEKLTVGMRQVMEKAFRCRIYEEYSTVENVLFASECEKGRLHISPDVGIVEILRPDGSPCNPGEPGEVVTTCLMRSLQPLIRYRLGDVAAWDTEQCSCGRSMPIIREVIGRMEDVVIGPDGRQMVRFHGVFVHQPHIIEGQVIQESLDQILVKVVPTEEYNEADTQSIIHRVQQRLGNTVTVKVEKVDIIPRTTAGKFKAVISKVNS